MINFVSNLPADLRSGGFSGLNWAAREAISKAEAIAYIGPVNPKPFFSEKLTSSLLRRAGGSGDFFFFSRRRLEAIAATVQAQCDAHARLDCFHGFTPWILTRPPRPYLAWSDCSFRDYIDIYHRRSEFRAADLDRIERAEAQWLTGARRVLFTSRWAASRAVDGYQLDAGRVGVIGISGDWDVPRSDVYEGGKQFAFLATDFEAKGGPTALAALKMVRKRHPDASLVVVGPGPSRASEAADVEFTGFLRKEVPVERDRLRSVLCTARAIVHPTRSDVAPLLIVEAGHFGCPAIASRRFAIPELVDDGRTGILLDDLSPEAVAAAMIRMIENDDEYRRMRAAAREKARTEHSLERFEQRLQSFVFGGEGEQFRERR